MTRCMDFLTEEQLITISNIVVQSLIAKGDYDSDTIVNGDFDVKDEVEYALDNAYSNILTEIERA